MAGRSSRAEDLSVSVFSVTPRQLSGAELLVSDQDKAGATLVFCGVFLGLVGITFTAMGWAEYGGMAHLEWTQLLGPILLSVGVTFLLIAGCKFKMPACVAGNQSEERPSEVDQGASGPSFVFTGISQPITFHGTTVVQYIPSYPIQEVVGTNPAHFHQLLSHSQVPPFPEPGIPGSNPPYYCNVFPLDNLAFAGDENLSACLAVDTRSERTAEGLEETPKEEACQDFSPPPYEKLFPLSS
ncbi:hypothetical protein lerEdw1_000347 [Lerista edwardsae]|nr:hypothetical protein lerEdw1_000347 [Lerista edwardsae]